MDADSVQGLALHGIYDKRSEHVATLSRASHWIRLGHWHWNLVKGFDDVDFIVLFGNDRDKACTYQMNLVVNPIFNFTEFGKMLLNALLSLCLEHSSVDSLQT